MKILIFGATGNVGRRTVTAALRAGHTVTAVGRNTAAITERDDALVIEQGDVQKGRDVERLTPGHDVVIATFGAPLGRSTILHQPDVCQVGTQNIVSAMTASGVPRLICMTSLGAGDSRGHGRPVFARLVEPVLLGRIMKDRNAQEDVVRASGLPAWVIVRPAELSDDDTGGDVRVITNIQAQPEPEKISRGDVAAFLVSLVDDRTYDGSAVVITS